MAEPKKKLTKTRSGNRRSHDALVGKSPSKCSNCGAMVQSHRVCSNCGFYKGKKVINIK